jgi:ATP-dependent Clp protease ATP-binding subunit ClpA
VLLALLDAGQGIGGAAAQAGRRSRRGRPAVGRRWTRSRRSAGRRATSTWAAPQGPARRGAPQSKEFKDEYVSSEHLLLALRGKDSAPPARAARTRACASDALMQALAEVRGTSASPIPRPRASTRRWPSTRATSPSWPATGSWTRSSAGTRRCGGSMQVLSPPTKNNPVLIGEPGRGQDRHRRGDRPAHRRRRRARVTQGQAHPIPGPGRAGGRDQVPR